MKPFFRITLSLAGILAAVSSLPVSAKVNLKTGAFYFPSEDLSLPCPIPIRVFRAYTSHLITPSPFGPGWSFSFSVQVWETANQIIVREHDGYESAYTPDGDMEQLKNRQIEQIILERKKEDSKKGPPKPESHYNQLRKLLKTDARAYDSYFGQYLKAKPFVAPPGKYKSLSRGSSELTKEANGSYRRLFGNGLQEIFNSKGRLIKQVDRNNNFIELGYNSQNQLRTVSDSCKRSITISYHPTLKDYIEKITDSLNRTVVYTYHTKGPLTGLIQTFTDPNKGKTSYLYDEASRRITRVIFPRNDPKEKESWLAMTYDKDLNVSTEETSSGEFRSFKRTNVDGKPDHLRVTIQLRKQGQPAGREVHEYKPLSQMEQAYDNGGRLVKHETTNVTACCGRPGTVIDHLRGVTLINEYDDQTGNLIKSTLSTGEVNQYEYEPKYSQVQRVRSSVNGTSLFMYDDKGNPTLVYIAREGTVVLMAYNSVGKISQIRRRETPAKAEINKIAEKSSKLKPEEIEKIRQLILASKMTSREEVKFDYNFFAKPTVIQLVSVGSILITYYATGETNQVEAKMDPQSATRFGKMNPEDRKVLIIQDVREVLQNLLAIVKPDNLSIGL